MLGQNQLVFSTMVGRLTKVYVLILSILCLSACRKEPYTGPFDATDMFLCGSPEIVQENPRSMVLNMADPTIEKFIHGNWENHVHLGEKTVNFTDAHGEIWFFLADSGISKVHMKLSAQGEMNKYPLEINLNQIDIGEVTTRETPDWYTLDVPSDLLKPGMNRLHFYRRSPPQLSEVSIGNCFKVVAGSQPDEGESRFTVINRLSLDRINLKAGIISGSGDLTFQFPPASWRKVIFRVGYPAVRTIKPRLQVQIQKDNTWQDILDKRIDIKPGSGWEDLECELSPGINGLRFRVTGNLAVGRVMLIKSPSGIQVKKPDVILVSVDTLRADHLGAYGNHRMMTPFLDRLSQKSRLFSNTYSQAAVTNPSHASVFTGLYVHQHKVFGNLSRLPLAADTWPEALQQDGYRIIASVGARHMAGENSGFDQGFDEYVDTFESKRDGRDVVNDLLPSLKFPDTRPLMVFCHLFDPHIPYGETPFRNAYDPKDVVIRESVFTPNPSFDIWKTQQYIAHYKAEITDADRCVQLLWKSWRNARPGRPLLMIVMADHGESLYEHGQFFQHHAGLYEPQVRVPLIFYTSENQWLPGITLTPVQLIDISATILKTLKIIPKKLMNRRQTLFNGNVDSQLIYSEMANFATALWRNDEKLIQPWHQNDDIQEPLLFDLDQDPDELNNIRDTNPDSYKAMHSTLETWHHGTVDAKLYPEARAIKKSDMDSLKALGYVQ